LSFTIKNKLTVLRYKRPMSMRDLVIAAQELRQREFARLAQSITPPIEVFRPMTADEFRNDIALMLQRLGHTVVTAHADIVTTKAGQKFIEPNGRHHCRARILEPVARDRRRLRPLVPACASAAKSGPCLRAQIPTGKGHCTESGWLFDKCQLGWR
jgi:hypothetical protein